MSSYLPETACADMLLVLLKPSATDSNSLLNTEGNYI